MKLLKSQLPSEKDTPGHVEGSVDTSVRSFMFKGLKELR